MSRRIILTERLETEKEQGETGKGDRLSFRVEIDVDTLLYHVRRRWRLGLPEWHLGQGLRPEDGSSNLHSF